MTTLDRIRELCTQNGINVTKLEKELGFGNGSLTKKDTSSIKADRLFAIAKRFDVTMEYLLTGQGKEIKFSDLVTEDVNFNVVTSMKILKASELHLAEKVDFYLRGENPEEKRQFLESIQKMARASKETRKIINKILDD